MRVGVTGGAGFIGQLLVNALASRPDVDLVVVLDTEAALNHAHFEGDVPDKVRLTVVDVTDRRSIAAALSLGLDVVVHFAGIMSAQSEANLELGVTVNIIGTVNVLLECAALQQGKPIRVLYASSVAAYDSDHIDAIESGYAENDAPVYHMASASYGVHKGIGEMLISDLSRRGAIDGLTLRLPTVTARSGVPSGAASSFVSDIIREPLHGRRANCPVSTSTKVCICSPGKAVESFIKAIAVDTSLLPRSRVIVIPGLTVTVQEMLSAVAKHANIEALVSYEHSENVAAIVEKWPAIMDSLLSRDLGFSPDSDIDVIVDQYMTTYLRSNK